MLKDRSAEGLKVFAGESVGRDIMHAWDYNGFTSTNHDQDFLSFLYAIFLLYWYSDRKLTQQAFCAF
jgi:hypothetical protein